MNNLVSVIIPTYNRSNYLPEAIESVLNQTYRNFEIIVVDDGSTDCTRDVVKRYEEKVRYVYQKNSGLPSALNTGIKNSKGRYLAFLDDDDLWKDEMLKRTVEMMENAGKEVGVVYVDYRYFRDSDRNKLINKGMKMYSGDVFEKLLQNNFIPVNTVLIKKECIEKVGCFDEALPAYRDWELLLRIAFAGFKFKFINEPLALIRVHNTNMSSQLLRMKKGGVKTVEKFESMVANDSPKKYVIKKALAKRHLSLGWYLTLHGYRREGKEEIRNAVPMDAKQVIQKQIAYLLTFIPNTVLLQKINLLIESIFGQRNPYRHK